MVKFRLRQGYSTMIICFKQNFEGGFLQNISEHIVLLARFVLMIWIWKALAGAGADLGGLTGDELLTYTLISFVFRWQMNILTPATSSLWEGSVLRFYHRPMPVYMGYAAETIGRRWLPVWLFFALPLALLIAPVMGIPVLPASAAYGGYFALSMLLSVIIGFGIDMLFVSLAIRLKNAVWIATRIRESAYDLLSGAAIPFALFPEPARRFLSFLPFGSIGNAPLMLYIGRGDPRALLLTQVFWAIAIWLIAHPLYKKSEERMVSYGG